MSKKLVSIALLFFILLGNTAVVFAHGGEGEATVDVPTLVKQSIAFIEGIEDVEMAEDKLAEAIEANEESNEANHGKLIEAMAALESSRLEEAKILMIEAIGGDAADLELEPGFTLSVTNIILLILALILLLTGLVLLNKNRIIRGEHNHE